MKGLTRVSIALACALGVSAVYAQSVQRGDKVVSKPQQQTVAQASAVAPIQTAQAGAAAGGAAGGASGTGGFAAGIGTAGTIGSTTVFVGSAIAATAASAGATNPTVSH